MALEYIDGKSFFDLKQKPTAKERDFLVRQAALINGLQIRPKLFYDYWAVVNFLKEYQEVKKHLEKKDIKLIDPLAEKFKQVDVKSLPRCLVHGDIIETNVIRSQKGRLYIFDFSVANIYPRIQELAVMLCDILFVPERGKFQAIYQRTLDVYQKEIKLEKAEIEALPLLVRAAHAMHIIGSVKYALEEGDFEENKHWIKMGREGLAFTRKFRG
ncbi:MAG: phosphotransferase [Candidatus Pacebacteria bacterium]|nr:phosphotransferase [Candidatus Paceibacterota bacterium]